MTALKFLAVAEEGFLVSADVLVLKVRSINKQIFNFSQHQWQSLKFLLNETKCSSVTKYLTIFLVNISGSGSQDADSDEEWPALGESGAGDSDGEYETEVVISADDEKAIEMFMNKNPPMRQDIT